MKSKARNSPTLSGDVQLICATDAATPVPQHRPASFKTTRSTPCRAAVCQQALNGSWLCPFWTRCRLPGWLAVLQSVLLGFPFPSHGADKAGWQDDRPIGIHRQCRYRNGKWFPKFPWSWFGPCPSLGFWMMNPEIQTPTAPDSPIFILGLWKGSALADSFRSAGNTGNTDSGGYAD